MELKRDEWNFAQLFSKKDKKRKNTQSLVIRVNELKREILQKDSVVKIIKRLLDIQRVLSLPRDERIRDRNRAVAFAKYQTPDIPIRHATHLFGIVLRTRRITVGARRPGKGAGGRCRKRRGIQQRISELSEQSEGRALGRGKSRFRQ